MTAAVGFNRHGQGGVVLFKGIPAERVLPIYGVTGVTPHELRPDLYPNPTDGLPNQEP
ncbi:helix-turn-helix domain-containing protein [Enterobacter hormaechei]|nr:helix-turn-helix domain-containing protein [Enterobacter hormaechei]